MYGIYCADLYFHFVHKAGLFWVMLIIKGICNVLDDTIKNRNHKINIKDIHWIYTDITENPSFSFLCHPFLLFCLIKSLYESLKFFPGHLFDHALTFVNWKRFSRASKYIPWDPRKICMYMWTIWALLQFHFAESAQTTSVWVSALFRFCCPLASTRFFVAPSSFERTVSIKSWNGILGFVSPSPP